MIPAGRSPESALTSFSASTSRANACSGIATPTRLVNRVFTDLGALSAFHIRYVRPCELLAPGIQAACREPAPLAQLVHEHLLFRLAEKSAALRVAVALVHAQLREMSPSAVSWGAI